MDFLLSSSFTEWEREGERQNILGLKAGFGERSVFYDSY